MAKLPYNARVEQIRQARKEKNWTQAQMGLISGFSKSFIGNVESYQVELTEKAYEKIIKALRIPRIVLIKEKAQTPPKPPVTPALPPHPLLEKPVTKKIEEDRMKETLIKSYSGYAMMGLLINGRYTDGNDLTEAALQLAKTMTEKVLNDGTEK